MLGGLFDAILDNLFVSGGGDRGLERLEAVEPVPASSTSTAAGSSRGAR